MGLFSKRKEDPKPSPAPAGRIRWVTDAPEHWPTIETDALPFPEPATIGEHGEDVLMFAASMKRSFQAAGGDCRLKAIFRNRLTPRGILLIWLEVTDREGTHAVFPYFDLRSENPGHFSAARALLAERGEPRPYYYALRPFPHVAPDTATGPFDPELLKTAKEIVPGRYAMWWASENQPAFDASETVRSIRRTYECLEGVQSYILAAVLRSLKLVEKEVGRFVVEEDVQIPLVGFEGRPIYLSLSREKGVQFQFHTERCSPEYRDAFYRLFSEYVATLRAVVEEKALPRDKEDPEFRPLGWWGMMEKVPELSRAGGGGETQFVGLLQVVGEAPEPAPSAAS